MVLLQQDECKHRKTVLLQLGKKSYGRNIFLEFRINDVIKCSGVNIGAPLNLKSNISRLCKKNWQYCVGF